jgi:hypothetical protein
VSTNISAYVYGRVVIVILLRVQNSMLHGMVNKYPVQLHIGETQLSPFFCLYKSRTEACAYSSILLSSDDVLAGAFVVVIVSS